MRGGIDRVSLGAGAAFVGLGALLALDSAGALDLTWGWVAAAVAAVAGAILVLSGLDSAGPGGQD